MIGRRAALQAAGIAALWDILARPSLARADDETLIGQGASPQNLATPLAYFDRLITPTSVFFVRSHFGPPALDKARKTTIDGLVKTPLTFNVDELRKLGLP